MGSRRQGCATFVIGGGVTVKRFIDTADPPVAENKAIIYQDSPLRAHRVPLSRTITWPDSG